MGKSHKRHVIRVVRLAPLQSELLRYITKPVEEQTMDKPTQRVAPRTLRRLNQGEYYKLYKWIEGQTFEPGLTRARVANMATQALGMEIADVHIGSALRTMGMSLPTLTDPENLADRVAKLEQEVERLIQLVGHDS